MEPPGWDKSRAHRLLLRRGRQRSDTATIPTYEENATHGAAGAFDPATATMGLTDLLLQLHEGVPSVGPDRNEFAQNLAQAITKLIEEKQNAISQSVNSPSPNVPQPATASPRAVSPLMPRKSSRPEASGPPEDFCLDDILHEPDAAQAFHKCAPRPLHCFFPSLSRLLIHQYHTSAPLPLTSPHQFSGQVVL
jgi:hypothetical protein